MLLTWQTGKDRRTHSLLSPTENPRSLEMESGGNIQEKKKAGLVEVWA